MVSLPPASSPVYSHVARYAVLSPVFVAIGYGSMRYPRAFVVTDSPLLVDDADDVSGVAVARRQLIGFVVAAFGVAFAFGAAVDAGVAPRTVAVVSVVAVPVGVLLATARDTVAGVHSTVPLVGRVPDQVWLVVEYVGVALLVVGVGGGVLSVFAALAA